MSFLLCLGVKEGPLPVCFAVVFELECISGDQDLSRADKSTQGLLSLLTILLVYRLQMLYIMILKLQKSV